MGENPPPDVGGSAQRNRSYCTLPVFVPLARDRFEGIVSRNLRGPFTLPFHYGRIDVSSEVTFGFIPRSVRLHQPIGPISDASVVDYPVSVKLVATQSVALRARQALLTAGCEPPVLRAAVENPPASTAAMKAFNS